MTLTEISQALAAQADYRTTAKRLSDDVKLAENMVVECATRWAASRVCEGQWPQVHSEDCDALAEAVEHFHKAEAAEEQHHMGGAA